MKSKEYLSDIYDMKLQFVFVGTAGTFFRSSQTPSNCLKGQLNKFIMYMRRFI